MKKRFPLTPPADINEAMAAYEPYCRSVASKYARVSSATFDDCYSAALIGLWRAIRGFDVSKGFQFLTYAKRRVVGAILDMRRMEHTHGTRRTKRAPMVSLDALLDASRRDVDYPSESRVTHPTYLDPSLPASAEREAFDVLTRGLPERDRAMLWRHYGLDEEQPEIAASMRLPATTVYGAIVGSRKKIRRWLGSAA